MTVKKAAMEYDYPLYRPPSEAYSLIMQVTVGCLHNTCTFCTMYKGKKYREKSWPEIKTMITAFAREYPHTSRIFLADGDALSLPTETLYLVLQELYTYFPRLERVSIYGSPRDVLQKTEEELVELRKQGLQLIYMGIESGSEKVLAFMKKGVNSEQIIEAGKKIVQSGLTLSATIISGLGGKENWEEHAFETARVVSAIQPHYLASLTLLLEEGVILQRKIDQGEFTLLTPWEILRENQLLLENLQLEKTIYRANHVSNYFRIAGVLNKDKNRILQEIKQALQRDDLKRVPVDLNRRL